MSKHRIERVRELLKREIGEAIRREVPVDQAGLVTVNDVKMAGDLKSALVFISILGDDSRQKTALGLVEKARVRIQDSVATSVILKYTPRLHFHLDDSIVRGNRVLQILEEIEKSDSPK